MNGITAYSFSPASHTKCIDFAQLPVQRHGLSLRSPPAVRPPLKESRLMNNLKLRALPLVGALSLIASMAGYLGGR
jgi:hypothetical protein